MEAGIHTYHIHICTYCSIFIIFQSEPKTVVVEMLKMGSVTHREHIIIPYLPIFTFTL